MSDTPTDDIARQIARIDRDERRHEVDNLWRFVWFLAAVIWAVATLSLGTIGIMKNDIEKLQGEVRQLKEAASAK